MSKRRQRQEQGASWMEEDDMQEPTSLREVVNQGYGLNIPSQERIIAKPISIFDIYPDPAQPRRTIPSSIRVAWNGTPASVEALLLVWWDEVQRERGQSQDVEILPFDLTPYLDGGKTERSESDEVDYKSGPLESTFMKIVMLAASIRRDGLTNPVTVAPFEPRIGAERRYRLETGERRWMAYHLLHAWFNGTEGRPDERSRWERIPAREMEAVDVWRQASENNARDNLNAIGKARQYAVLMMDLHGVEKFRPIEMFRNEREYYAQAADLTTPYGKREELLNALGVSSPSVMTRLRQLLQLPDEIWQGGDDFDLSEDKLKTLSEVAQKDPQKAITMYRQIVLIQNGMQEEPKPTGPIIAPDPGTKKHFSTVLRAVHRSGVGRHADNMFALRSLSELREWINVEEDRIRRLLSDK